MGSNSPFFERVATQMGKIGSILPVNLPLAAP